MTNRRGFLGAAAAAVAAPAIIGAQDKAGARRPVIGSGAHQYEVIHDWGELPAGLRYGNTHGVVQDSQGRMYVHHTVHASSDRHDSMVVFDQNGRFIKSWGAEFEGGAHGLYIRKEGSQEFLYLCDTKRALVVKATLDGEVVYSFGYPDQSEQYKPGADGQRKRYTPTNLAVAPNGDLYVADGYGSSFVNQYNAKGEFIRTFGGRGAEPGQLAEPHGIAIDHRYGQPEVLVADRRNHRLQYFTLDGKHIRFVDGLGLPCHFDVHDGVLLIPELDSRVTLLDRQNKLIAYLGEDKESNYGQLRRQPREAFKPGKFVCPHGACFDRDGNIFVVEWVEIGRVTKLRRV